MGFQVSGAALTVPQADIIIWDFDKLEMVQRLKLHKVLIQSLSFSPNEKYLASLGGQDDNTLVIWDVRPRPPNSN